MMFKITITDMQGHECLYANQLTNKQAFTICCQYNWRVVKDNKLWYMHLEDDD